MVLALAALGLSMIFGTTGLTNFAHGELVTIGAVIAWYINSWGIWLPLAAERIDVTLPGQVPILDPAATHLPYRLAGTLYLGKTHRQLPFAHTGRLHRPGTVSP